MGVREIDWSLEQWQMGVKDLRRRMILAPAHRGPAIRSYLETPGLNLRLVNLPGYSPDFNADEAVWGWVREEATANLCLGSKTLVRGKGQRLPRRAGQPER